VLSDGKAYVRDDERIALRMTALFGISSVALLTGWILAGRSYVRAVDLARRQSEFMAAVSHEMRTPLAAMRLLAENLESGVAERSGQTTQHSRLIREECARLGGLVENILAFTRKRRVSGFEAFDVRNLVEDAVQLVRPLSEKKSVRLAVTVADFPEPPTGDAAEIRRLLLNLLDNALKHAPDGGRVDCTVTIEGSDWLLEVADNGPGIPKQERSRIFDPFYRIGDELRRATPGTGLGLALVKRTAAAPGSP
jgi:signal transduction histidine kinase